MVGLKRLLYVCEADSGGIMEYAIRQSAALVNQGVEVHFLCKESFPKERLAAGIVVEKFVEGLVASIQRRGLAGKLSTIWRLTLGQRLNAKSVAELATKLAQTSSTHHQLLTTSNYLGSPEVAVLFACYKEYFAPFWVWPLRRLAKKGVAIGTIAHDPIRDFVVGPIWWHRWSVRLGYSFVRYVFVHDDTPVDFGGKRPEGIQVHQIPHGPYEVAEPKIGRLEMRRQLGFLTTDDSDRHGWGTTKDTNTHERGEEVSTTIERQGGREMEQPKVGPKGEGVGTTESNDTDQHGYFQKAQGHAQGTCAGDSEPDSLASELADSPVSESLTRSASGPDGALRARSSELEDRRSGEGVVHKSSGGEGSGSTRPEGEISRAGAKPELPVCEQCLDGGRSTLDWSSPATGYSPLATSASPDVVFLAFGQIRDGKNLDLFLRSMTHLPETVKLLVAGKWDSGSSRPPEFYQKLAEELGVADRCRWDIRLIPDYEVGDFFAASDAVLVTYSAKFHSASGVLNTAVSARKPVLVSSGSGPLKTVVNKYRLGIFVEPDNLEEIIRGASELASRNHLHFTPASDWDRYELENSWLENAGNVLEVFFSQTAKKTNDDLSKTFAG